MIGIGSEVERAARSEGRSHRFVHDLVRRAVRDCGVSGGRLVDVGCGDGALIDTLAGFYDSYTGCDLVRYEAFPCQEGLEFVEADLNNPPMPLGSDIADLVVSVETIEHLENPRAFVRELVRVAKPGGYVMLTTPNQLSLLSKATLLLKNQFNAFREPSYPAHITALLESDLRRIAMECGITDIQVRYSNYGRIIGTARPWPRVLSGRAFSDNVLLMGRKPMQQSSHG